DCLLLPPDYLSSLPHDLRLDVSEGDLFLRSDNAMICALLVFLNCLLPPFLFTLCYVLLLLGAALGKRLVSAGRRFQAMGQYADGEPQKVKA
ncbi:hypothetical protein BHE74_00035080, partial [Ensete ventricosum]